MNRATFQAQVRQAPRFWYHVLVLTRTRFVLLLGLASCSSAAHSATLPWTPGPAPDLGAVVARVGGVPIFAKQVLAEAARSGLSPRTALTTLLDDSVAADGARALGRALPAHDDREVESTLVQRFLERELEPVLTPDAIPDSVLHRLYDLARDNYVHPRLVEVALLALFTGEQMPADRRQEREQAAKDLLGFLAKHPVSTLADFEAIAGKADWSERGVSYRRLIQGLDRPLSKTVGREVAKLRAPGDTTGLIVDPDGYYIARYVGEQPAESISFEQARAKLAASYFERWRQEQFLSMTAKLLQGHRIEAYFDRVTSDEQGR